MAKRQKNRQHNGQKTEEQTTQWSKDRRIDNTMVKRQKNRQHNGQKKKYKRTKTTIYKKYIKLKIEKTTDLPQVTGHHDIIVILFDSCILYTHKKK
jgi:beta-lactamase regulating signal transducer with metallopeptidase domain